MRKVRLRAEFGAARSIQLARHVLHRIDPAVAAAKRQRAAFYDQVWSDAARSTGAQSERLGGSIWEIRRVSRRTLVDLNYTALDDPVTLRLVGDKGLVHRLLGRAGVPIPAHLGFGAGSMDAALRFLQEAPGPVVVKPQRQTGAGQGVTTGVRTRRQLLWAAASAAVYRKGLLVERQVSGSNYRLLFLDGELLDVVRRDPPAVIGDGKASVRELVVRANRERLAGGVAAAQTLLLVGQAMSNALAQQGLSLGAIPAAGREVLLSEVINDNRACENASARDELCPAIVDTARRAAALLGVRFAGVDVISADPSRPLEASGGVVLEVNTAPGFHMHYHRRGEPCRVAEHVLTRLLGDAAELDDTRRVAGASTL